LIPLCQKQTAKGVILSAVWRSAYNQTLDFAFPLQSRIAISRIVASLQS
jgi:hypothetical protein